VGVLAVTSSTIGGAWDISWHRSIGRDTFRTPGHMAIYACGVIATLMLPNGSNTTVQDAMNHDAMNMDMSAHNEPLSNTVEFLYMFPPSGRYRIYVQMKHSTTIETGAFDVTVP
jgi:hypothetical protein